MVIYVGEEITTAVGGQRLEAVACEKCGTPFYYELTRLGTGKASAPLFLFKDSAHDRATAAAERDLAARLAREAELVPCPKCHWVNQDLVERYRRRQYRRAPVLIVIVVVAGFVAGPLVAGALWEVFGHNSRAAPVAHLVVTAVALLSPAWILLIRRHLRRRIDPNATHPRRPAVPPGTPPALLERRDPQTGEAYLEPVASRADDASDDGPGGQRDEWAVFRPGQVRFPPVCCLCIEPATTTYRPPFQVDKDSDVAVPLCGPCDAWLGRRWWVVAVRTAVLVLAFVGIIAMLIPGIDSFGRWALFIIFGGIGALVGGVVTASRKSRPYTMGVVDGDRGVIRFRAANPEFTTMLVEQVRASDGLGRR